MLWPLGRITQIFFSLVLVLSSIIACTSDISREKPAQQMGVETVAQTNTINENAGAPHNTLANGGAAVSLPPDSSDKVTITAALDSLQIKEICDSDDQCVFRQKCGKLRPTLKNELDQHIRISKIVFQQIDANGSPIADKTLNTSDLEKQIPPHSEAKFYAKLSCECRGDRYCTPEFPHLSNPFLNGRTEFVTVYYITEDGETGLASTKATYSLVR